MARARARASAARPSTGPASTACCTACCVAAERARSPRACGREAALVCFFAQRLRQPRDGGAGLGCPGRHASRRARHRRRQPGQRLRRSGVTCHVRPGAATRLVAAACASRRCPTSSSSWRSSCRWSSSSCAGDWMVRRKGVRPRRAAGRGRSRAGPRGPARRGRRRRTSATRSTPRWRPGCGCCSCSRACRSPSQPRRSATSDGEVATPLRPLLAGGQGHRRVRRPPPRGARASSGRPTSPGARQIDDSGWRILVRGGERRLPGPRQRRCGGCTRLLRARGLAGRACPDPSTTGGRTSRAGRRTDRHDR